MPNTKSTGVAYSDPSFDSLTVTGASALAAVTATTVAATGAVSGTTGSFTGVSTTLGLKLPVATVAAAGSVQGDAAAVLLGITIVTGADATKGVLLPTPVTPFGDIVIIKNIDAANAILKIWPAGSGIINALSASAAFSIAAKTSVLLVSTSATQWYSVPLLPS